MPIVVVVLNISSMFGETIGWRNDGSGVWLTATPPPSFDGSSSQGIAWKVELPNSCLRGAIEVSGRVYAVAEPDMLLCFDAKDGKELWRRNLDIVSTLKIGGLTGTALREQMERIRTTPVAQRKPEDSAFFKKAGFSNHNADMSPALDGTRIFVKFATGVVGAFDSGGNELWKTPLPGCGSPNLLLATGLLLVPQRGKGMVALNPSTGAIVWENPVGMLLCPQ